jgi:hypothetical protein
MIKLKLVEQEGRTKHPNGYKSTWSIDVQNQRGSMSIGSFISFGPSGDKYAQKIEKLLSDSDILSHCGHCDCVCEPDVDLCSDCFQGMTSDFQ